MPLAQPSVIGAPFCSAGTVTTDYVLPSTAPSTTVASQPNGVPPIQELPLTAGGLPVKRNEWNGTVRFYSSFIVWLNAGGQFTFDAAVVAQGGYSIGMILFDYATNRQVISLINNNTNNFVTTPSFIDNTNWAFYPRDLYTRNVPILGNTPASQITTARNGAYTQAVLQSGNGVSNNYANINATYSDAGNGVFKPIVSMTAQDVISRSGFVQVIPSGATSNYIGFYSSLVSSVTASQYSAHEAYYNNALGVMRATIFATNNSGGNTTSGIVCDAGKRPVLFQYTPGSVSFTDLGSLIVLNDFANSLSGNGFQRLPNGLIIAWIQLNQVNRTLQNYALPITFVNIYVCIGGLGNGISNTIGYTVSINCTTTTASVRYSSSAADGNTYSGYALIIGT